MNLKNEAINKGLSHMASAIIALQQFRNCLEGSNGVMECVVEILVRSYQDLEQQYLTPDRKFENVPERAPSTITP